MSDSSLVQYKWGIKKKSSNCWISRKWRIERSRERGCAFFASMFQKEQWRCYAWCSLKEWMVVKKRMSSSTSAVNKHTGDMEEDRSKEGVCASCACAGEEWSVERGCDWCDSIDMVIVHCWRTKIQLLKRRKEQSQGEREADEGWTVGVCLWIWSRGWWVCRVCGRWWVSAWVIGWLVK